jgi:hypothetical protein
MVTAVSPWLQAYQQILLLLELVLTLPGQKSAAGKAVNCEAEKGLSGYA